MGFYISVNKEALLLLHGTVTTVVRMLQKIAIAIRRHQAWQLAMAKLAFCVLILMSLECCQKFEHLETIKQYLGSDKGSIQQQEEKATETTEVKLEEPTSNDTTQKQVKQFAQAINGTHVAEDNGDEPFLQEEVWAAESHPIHPTMPIIFPA
jgi:hypothetical protein